MATICKESTEPLISPSLLLRIPEKHSKEAHKQFALGLGEWTESSSDGNKENVEPLERVPRKLKLSKTKAAPENCWRFVDKHVEDKLSKKYLPKSTASSTNGPQEPSSHGCETGMSAFLTNPASKFQTVCSSRIVLSF